MLEGLCRPNVYDKCMEVIGILWLADHNGKPDLLELYKCFFAPTDRFTVWIGGLTKKIVRSPARSTLRLAVSVFSKHGEEICDVYVIEHFGSWEKAIKSSGTFDNFYKGFERYFTERKKQFMDKTDKLIAQMPKQLTKDGRIRTNSHGGVANLLKVLTKTMHEQGSSIRTIAKVQYAICTQAGIYVPDEFITDVLVAADINPTVLEGE